MEAYSQGGPKAFDLGADERRVACVEDRKEAASGHQFPEIRLGDREIPSVAAHAG